MSALPNEKIERAYGLKIEEALLVRAAYRLETDRGPVFLKRSRLTENELRFVTTALVHLESRGFDRTPEVLKTLAGAPFCRLDGANYMLTTWRQGRECDYDLPDDALAAAELLADLHRASLGFRPPPGELRIWYGTWPSRFQRRLRDFDLFARLATKRENAGEFDSEFLRLFEAHRADGEEALRWLQASRYPELVFRARRDRPLCHHDLAHHNVIRESDGRVSLVDFDYALADLRVHDLANLLRRILKRNNWEPAPALALLERYDRETGLRPAEFAMLAILLWWPQDFWQVAFQFYVERQPWPLNRFIETIRKKATRPPAQRAFVERLWEIAGPGQR